MTVLPTGLVAGVPDVGSLRGGKRCHMCDILFVKTSSLGDVIHQMPAACDARRQRPDAEFSWVVEEAYAPLVRLHPAIDHVIPVATRRWRSAPLSPAIWREIRSFASAIRARRYDEIVDSQGLLRSALIARAASGRRHGYDAASVRERAASWLYDVQHRVARNLHAIARNRALTGLALGYTPDATVEFGLPRERLTDAAGYGVLLHATTRPEKEWPPEAWIALGRALCQRRLQLVLPWGTEAERRRSEHIAAELGNARVPARQQLDAMARLIAGASFVVGVDTGLLHLAAALGVPLVAIFMASNPDLTGPIGKGPIAVVGGKGQRPSATAVIDALETLL